MARKLLAELKQTETHSRASERLEDFIVRISPKLTKPMHLGAALEELNLVGIKPVRMLWSMPPRHGKSFTVMHLIVQTLAKDPTKRIAYITYGESLSLDHSRKIRQLCEEAGVELSKEVRAAERWDTKQGGFVAAVGIGGALTGKGFDLIIVDDPHKSRPEVESELYRNRVHDFFDSAIHNRLEPGGSIVIIHTRWHADDLIGRLYSHDKLNPDLATRENWKYFNIPAISDDGAALWPARYPIGELLKIKARNDYEWASMYQGTPRPRGGAVFRGTKLYEQLPTDVARSGEAIGLDLAYTAKTYSDFSVSVTGAKYGDKIYITNVRRKQCEPQAFAEDLRAERAAHPSATIFWFIGGIEKGIVSLMRNLGIHIRAEVARSDKFVRAQAVATAWNEGKILLPAGEDRWVSAFTSEVLSFTGVGDVHDDQVDALAAMYEVLGARRSVRGMGTERLVPFT